MHVFPYSQREGTPAATMAGAVPMHVRRERANRLIEAGKEMEREYAAQFLGTAQDVLFEQETKEGLCEGYTDRYLRVRAQGTLNTIEPVLLNAYKDGILYGK